MQVYDSEASDTLQAIEYKKKIEEAKKQYHEDKTLDSLTGLSNVIKNFVLYLVDYRDYARASRYLKFIHEEVVQHKPVREYDEINQEWLFGRHFQLRAKISGALEQWVDQFDSLMRARLAYSRTKDIRAFNKINSTLLDVTVVMARVCFSSSSALDKDKQRGWICVKNALILALSLGNEQAIGELIAEFSQFFNMPLLLKELHDELPNITGQLHYLPLNVSRSRIGSYAIRQHQELPALDFQSKLQSNERRVDNRSKQGPFWHTQSDRAIPRSVEPERSIERGSSDYERGKFSRRRDDPDDYDRGRYSDYSDHNLGGYDRDRKFQRREEERDYRSKF